MAQATIKLVRYDGGMPAMGSVLLPLCDVIEKCEAAGKKLDLPDGETNCWVVLTREMLDSIGLTWRDF